MLKGHDLNYLSKQPITVGLKLIDKEIQKTEEHKAWQMWVAVYPDMIKPCQFTKQNVPLMEFKPFSEFYRQATQKISHRTSAEILKEAYLIRKTLGK